MDKIKPLFTATATATGGRNGHTESSDGMVRADLSVPQAMGGPGRPGTWNSRDRETVSGTDFGDRMGVVADSSRNPLSTRSMWRATGGESTSYLFYIVQPDT